MKLRYLVLAFGIAGCSAERDVSFDSGLSEKCDHPGLCYALEKELVQKCLDYYKNGGKGQWYEGKQVPDAGCSCDCGF